MKVLNISIFLIVFVPQIQSFVFNFKGSLIQKSYLSALGSDLLFRPEDEDSPEFKEYLKNLLKMQTNRAKTGFAAPSSGSSDAYMAKLTRLKIERNARIRAGLPDVPPEGLDYSYKEIDYKNAL